MVFKCSDRWITRALVKSALMVQYSIRSKPRTVPKRANVSLVSDILLFCICGTAHITTRESCICESQIMSSSTSHTLACLSSVLGFDIIEYWTPDEGGELQCAYFYLSDSVKTVVRRIFPNEADFCPPCSDIWRMNSLKV
jgi:hypothetical protein